MSTKSKKRAKKRKKLPNKRVSRKIGKRIALITSQSARGIGNGLVVVDSKLWKAVVARATTKTRKGAKRKPGPMRWRR